MKVCRKLYQIFAEKFGYEKKKSKQFAMWFEQKIDSFIDHAFRENEYIKCVKKLV